MRIWLTRVAVIALLVGLAFGLRTERAFACLCRPDLTLTLDEFDAVFGAEVVEVGEDWSAAFAVSRVWKGDVEERVVRGRPRTNCDLQFTVGEKYVFYARRDAAGRLQFGGLCSTLWLEPGQDYPDWLGPGWPPRTSMVEPVLADTRSPEPPGTAAGTPDASSTAGDGPMVALLVAVALVLTGAAFVATRSRTSGT